MPGIKDDCDLCIAEGKTQNQSPDAKSKKTHSMNFFKIKTSWSNLELIPLKICIAAAYILVGAYFHGFVRQHWMALLVLFGVTVIWSVRLWITKMKFSAK